MSWGYSDVAPSGSTSAELTQANHSYYGGQSVSLFSNANNPNFTNSQINAHITNVQGRTGLQALGANSAIGATYNSLERQRLDAPKCHPNTRIAVINRLISWIKGEIDFDALILWLYGAAGAGKSAIAHTLSEICDGHGCLLATFFFWKTAAERSDVSRFVATIAYQVARAIPASRPLIEAAVEADPMVFFQSIDTQLAKLILEPLQLLRSTGFDLGNCPFVIIVDGLDECQGNVIQSGLVKSLAAAFVHSPLRIRVLIASRPEVYLQSTFNSSSIQPQLSRLALSGEYSPKEDIYRYLEDSFQKIRREHPLSSYIPSSWPSDDVLHELTGKSSGQFIFASTTVKYTGGDPYELPTRRLDVIRQLQPPRGEEDLPYAELNSLYNHVLSNVRDIKKVKDVLGVFLIVNVAGGFTHFPSTTSIDVFFFWQPGETAACLSKLASVIECGRDGRISLLHASLSDFLFDPARSHQLYLCRETVLSDCAALGLRHVRPEVLVTKEHLRYCIIVTRCIEFSPQCTPALREELSQLSLQTLYGVYEVHNATATFWWLSSAVVDMLHNQDLIDQYPHIISDFTTVFVHAFQKAELNEEYAVLVYYEQYSHMLQLDSTSRALFPDHFMPHLTEYIRQLIRKIVTIHPLRQRLVLTEQHYAMVAKHFMSRHLRDGSRLLRNADVFNSSNDDAKQRHSGALSALLCIAHVLPLACESHQILQEIFGSDSWSMPRSFHEIWRLGGWNDHIIQPARDAVLEYYKRYANPLEVEKYRRLHNLS